ncbi:MAG: Txe/YoeB family addiction module toxin [Bacteroidetes bacterium]|nr:Txe/YoeB family addiction module toxin [Bacteroidota bacterium]
MYEIVLSKQAVKDAKKIVSSDLKPKVEKLLKIIEENPFESPPFYEKLKGNLEGFFSRQINIQHRLVYEVFEEDKIVRILRMWTHYE